MLCWFFRFMISSAADSGSPGNRWARRHVTHCAGCRQFLQSCRTIDIRLRSEADRWQQAPERPSPWILPHVTRMQPPNHGFRIRMALAAAACLVIAAAVLFSLSTPAGRPHASGPATTAFIPGGAPWATQWVGLIPNPLAAEAERLTGDAKSGIRFLVACLDVRPLGADVTLRPSESSPPPQ